jgi:hypothetical protein
VIRGTFPTLRRRAAQAREAQLRMLARLQALDAACAKHMQHGAMAGGDPLTDSMFDQMQAAAEEGARPATPYPEGITEPRRDSRAWWITAITLLAALVSVALLLPARA